MKSMKVETDNEDADSALPPLAVTCTNEINFVGRFGELTVGNGDSDSAKSIQNGPKSLRSLFHVFRFCSFFYLVVHGKWTLS
jgi:hypothetical protein